MFFKNLNHGGASTSNDYLDSAAGLFAGMPGASSRFPPAFEFSNAQANLLARNY